MPSMQKLTLIGYLGKDPETRFTPSGAQVTQFSIATTETWKDKQSGEKKERTEWHTCETWGKLAEICSEYLHKGALIYGEGQLRTEKWQKDGVDRYTTKVRLDKMTMLITDRNRTKPSNKVESTPTGDTSRPAQEQDDFDEDIPF